MTVTETDTARFIFTPKESFAAEIDGAPQTLRPNADFVADGHWLLEKYPSMFKRVRVRFDVEQATAAPGERRAR